MSQTVPAIYDAGVFRPLEPVQLAQGTRVDVQLPDALQSRESNESAPTAAMLPWHDFIEQTYGSCADLGLERHNQGEFESRDPIT